MVFCAWMHTYHMLYHYLQEALHCHEVDEYIQLEKYVCLRLVVQ